MDVSSEREPLHGNNTDVSSPTTPRMSPSSTLVSSLPYIGSHSPASSPLHFGFSDSPVPLYPVAQSSLQSPSNLSGDSFGGAHDYQCPTVDNRNGYPINWTPTLPSHSGEHACGFDAHYPCLSVEDRNDYDHPIPWPHTPPSDGGQYTQVFDYQSDYPLPLTHTSHPNAIYSYPCIPYTIPDANFIGIDQRPMTSDGSHSYYHGTESVDCHAQYYPIQDMEALNDVRIDSHPYHLTYPTYGADSVGPNLLYESAYHGY